MIKFEHQLLSESEPLQFSLLWQGDDPMGWALIAIDNIQLRQGNKWNSPKVADISHEISNLDPTVLVLTVTNFTEPLPEGVLNYDLLLTNGQLFGYGSIEVQRRITA